MLRPWWTLISDGLRPLYFSGCKPKPHSKRTPFDAFCLFVNRGNFSSQCIGRFKSIGYGVFVCQLIELDGLDRFDPNVACPGNVAALTTSELRPWPQSNGLRLPAAQNCLEEFLLEEQHAVLQAELLETGKEIAHIIIIARGRGLLGRQKFCLWRIDIAKF